MLFLQMTSQSRLVLLGEIQCSLLSRAGKVIKVCCVAIESDAYQSLAMLVRRKSESLLQLLRTARPGCCKSPPRWNLHGRDQQPSCDIEPTLPQVVSTCKSIDTSGWCGCWRGWTWPRPSPGCPVLAVGGDAGHMESVVANLGFDPVRQGAYANHGVGVGLGQGCEVEQAGTAPNSPEERSLGGCS